MTTYGTPSQRTSALPAPTPPHRPRAVTPSELGFTPGKPVHWLSPGMLATTAGHVVISDVFAELLDKRELEGALPTRVHDERPGGRDDADVWFDYVADLGDGFNPTYSIAYLLAQDHLPVDGVPLPRGRFLMMGGDEVYPTPSKARYDDQTKGPYKAAMPIPPVGHRPNMYALPGNHDWYDGLSSFMRLFVKDGMDNIGGWCNQQARSYFAIQLPHRWWLLALDTQLGLYIDDAQLTYFHTIAQGLGPGDRVILCTPTPSWVEATDDPSNYDAIDYFMRTVLLPTGAEVKTMISGDLHHYARYSHDHRELITSGGGGAYLYPTHKLPSAIAVPPPSDRAQQKHSEETRTYTLDATFPSKAKSRNYAAGVLWRAPLQNVGMIGLLGAVQTLFMYSLLGMYLDVSRVTAHWLELPVALLGLLMLGGAIWFAKSLVAGSHGNARRILIGAVHGLVQLGLGIEGTRLWARYGYIHGHWPLPALATVAYFAVTGVLSMLVLCLYLLFASAFGVNVNELFSAQSIVDSKSFLRLHIDTTGALTVYPIGVPKVSRRWRARPDAGPAHAWLEPHKEIPIQLVEAPIVIR